MDQECKTFLSPYNEGIDSENRRFRKIKLWACVYCQLGKTLHNQVERTSFYKVDDLVASVKIRIDASKEKNETIDFKSEFQGFYATETMLIEGGGK